MELTGSQMTVDRAGYRREDFVEETEDCAKDDVGGAGFRPMARAPM